LQFAVGVRRRRGRCEADPPTSGTGMTATVRNPQHWGIFSRSARSSPSGVHAAIAGPDLHVIGWILMLARPG
jgi:hypothetical protein